MFSSHSSFKSVLLLRQEHIEVNGTTHEINGAKRAVPFFKFSDSPGLSVLEMSPVMISKKQNKIKKKLGVAHENLISV